MKKRDLDWSLFYRSEIDGVRKEKERLTAAKQKKIHSRVNQWLKNSSIQREGDTSKEKKIVNDRKVIPEEEC